MRNWMRLLRQLTRPARQGGAAGLVLLAAAAPAVAQTSARPASAADSVIVTGVVVDAETGAPLPATLVRVVELGRQDLAHRDGEFHLTNLPPGEYTLLFERIGYRRETRRITASTAVPVRLRVELRSSAIELPGLVVTGTIGARLGDEAVRPTTVISGQELLRKLDMTLATSLQQEPGLAATAMGPATARPVIRGLGGDRVLVLEDGVRTGDMSASSPDHAVAVDPLNARRLEVVRGPAALLYGSNAIGGVVNIIREEIPVSLPDRLTGTLSAQTQSVNRGGAIGGTASGALGSFAVRAEGTLRGAGDLRVPGDVLANTALRTYDLSVGVSAIEPWGHAGVAYRLYDNAYGVPGDPDLPGAHAFGVDVEMRRHAVHAELHRAPRRGPFSALDATANYTHYYHREIEDVGITGTEFGLLTGAAELVARHGHVGPLGDGAIGVRVQWQDFAAGGAIGTPPAQEWGVAGFFLEEKLLGPVVLQFGGRYDWHHIAPLEEIPDSEIGHIRRRSFGSVSGSLGGHYDFGHGWHLGANIARAYRTPSITELYSLGPHLAAFSFEVGNPELDAEYGLGFDVFVRVAREDLRGEIAVFRNDISNYIYYQRTGEVRGDVPVFRAVAHDALLTGVEGSVKWSPVRHLVLEGVASHVRGTNRGTDEPLPLIPPLNGRVQVRYDRPAYFVGAGWNGAASQTRVATEEFEAPTESYGLFNAVAGYRWVAGGRIHNVSLRADNITNVLYRDHLSRIKAIMPEAGRNISLTYRLTY